MKKQLLILVAMLFAVANMWAQRDVTSYITNPTLSSTDGWTVVNKIGGPQVATNGSDYCLEFYAGWGSVTTSEWSVTQTITLPKGTYRLVNYSFFRQGGAYSDASTTSNGTLKAGSTTATIKTLGSITATGYANNLADAAGILASKEYRNTVEFTITADNTPVEIGVSGTFDTAKSWCAVGPFELYNLDEKPNSSYPENQTYKIKNSSIEYQGTDGWTNSGSISLGSLSTSPGNNPKIGTYFVEKWGASGSVDFNQTVSSLPAGKYTVGVRARNEASAAAYVYANDSKTAFTQSSTGNYTTDVMLTSTGSIKLGVSCDSHPSNTWFAVDHFTLFYNGNCVKYYATDYASSAAAGTWYAIPVAVSGDYTLTTSGASITYTQDGDEYVDDITTTATNGTKLTLAAGTIYVKASAATTISIAAQSYSYVVGSATVDKSGVQPGQTVTVTYADLATNDTGASLTQSFSGVKLNGSTVSCTATANGFTFVVPSSVTAGSTCTLTIPAKAIGYAAGNVYNAAQTIEFSAAAIFDQTAYLYNPKTGKFLSRGSSYGTAAIVDNYGIPVKIVTDANGNTTFQFVDNALYLFNADWAYADGANALDYTAATATIGGNTGVTLTSTYGKVYINGERVANNGTQGDNYTDEKLTLWQVYTQAQRDAAKTTFVLNQHKAIAAAAGSSITNESGFNTFIANFKATEDKTSSVSGASFTGSMDAAWTSTNVRNTNGAYAINDNGTECYQSANTFTQTVSGLSEGVYKVTLNGYFRQGSNANCVTYAAYDLSTAYIQANDYQINFATWASDRTADDAPNGQGAAKTLFDAGKYLNTLYTYVGSDGKLVLTISNPNYLASGWLNFENLTLTYLYNETLDEAYAKLATALTECAPWDGATYATYTSTQSAYTSKTYKTVTAVHTAITELRAAYEEFLKNNYSNEHPYDGGWIKNPSYDSDMTNWATTGNQTGSGTMGVTTENGDKIFRSTYNTYMRHETVYQEGIVVPAGCYKLSAQMKGSPKDAESTFIYATDGAVAHWETPVFKGNTWYGYLTETTTEWTEVYTFITLASETTLRVGALSWGNNYSGGNGGAFSVDDWKLEKVSYATEVLGSYVIGDVNGDGDITVKDVPALVDGLINNAALTSGADANNDGTVNVADVDATAQLVLSGVKTVVEDKPVKYIATVYTEQQNSENASGNVYQLVSSVNVDPATVDDISAALTTIKVNVSGISNIQSVSVYAKGKENIAGILSYNTRTKEFTVSNGSAPSGYAKGMNSDVVTVNNDNSASSFTAYLLPTTLTNGVTVTVRTTSDAYYTQDFSVSANQVNNLSFTNTTKSGAWMATVPGDIHFNYLSIPGAHDAATSSCSSLGKCQSLTIPQLLNEGVRSLDLRPYGSSSATADNMTIHHGILDSGVKFKDALGYVASYLQANPSETVFILVHDEKGDGATAWKNAVLSCIQNYESYVKVIDNNMLLDDCRGKMVIISRDDVASSTLLGKCGWGSSFGDKTVFYGISNGSTTPWTLMYQDEYETTNTTTRLSDVEKLLNNYIKNNEFNANRIYINTINISSSIESNAKTMNQKVAESSSFNNWTGRIGIVSGDFLCNSTDNGDDLFKMVVDQNYKYIYKGRSRK